LHLKLALSQVASGGIAIGELARRAGLRASAIRYYESIGLLPAPGRVAGKRRYQEEALQRLSVIAAGRHAGLTLEEVRQLLGADETGRVSARLQQVARDKLPEVAALIERAQAVRSWLEAAAGCTCPSLQDCPLFEVDAGPR
jgi:MerR family transcriptional regulator, redox-sensitive transcriptional activator SoxR